jgi:hypothetical protein
MTARARVVREMPAELYHSDPAIGSTAIKALLRSAAHYKSEYLDGVKRDETKALRIGTYIHTAALEPERWKRDFFTAPEWLHHGNSKEGKAERAAFRASVSPNHKTVDDDEYQLVEAIAASIRRHPAASYLLRDVAATELSLFWECETTGVACKARLDSTKRGVVVDLKSTEDASPEAFTKAIINYGYDSQCAHYWDGYAATHGQEPAGYFWIVVEKSAPYAVAVYSAGEDVLARGRTRRLRALDRLCESRASGIYPGYGDMVQQISLPSWAA